VSSESSPIDGPARPAPHANSAAPDGETRELDDYLLPLATGETEVPFELADDGVQPLSDGAEVVLIAEFASIS